MRENLRGALWRLAVYAFVCVLGAFALIAVFAQLRFQSEKTYAAQFANVSGLEGGNFVRIAGVEVGKVKSIDIQPDSTLLVKFTAADNVVLTEGTRAAIRFADLVGGRYVALEEGAGGVKRLHPGETIPLSRTEPALDLDALIGGFRPLFRALDPEQVNKLTGQLIAAFQGQGATIGSFLSQAAALTNTLADRDQLIGQVVVNLNSVLGSLGGQSAQLGKAVDSLAELVDGLNARKQDISDGVAYANAAAGSIAGLLAQARPPLNKVVHEVDRTAVNVLADHDYFDNFLNTWPDALQILNRQGMYGDFFSFYFCEIVLKVNGKGGQPIYVKLADQPTGEVHAPMRKPFSERNPIRIGLIGIAFILGLMLLAVNYDKLPFFPKGATYSAYFAEAGGLMSGNIVQVSGFRVGQVSSVELDGPRVLVTFDVANNIRLGDRTEAAIKLKTLLGTKILEVTPRGDGKLSAPIPLDRTTPAYQLPDALGDLTTTISGLDTNRLSKSLAVLADTFSNTPPDLKVAVQGLARFSQTLDARDAQLRDLLSNANKATKVLSDRSDEIVNLVGNTNSLLVQLRSQSSALDQIANNLSALAQQLKGFIAENRDTLKPTLDRLNGVLTIVDNRKERVQKALVGLNRYALGLGESVSSGPFFKAYIPNLVPGQWLQPFIDAAFSDLGLDPNTALPTQRADPQVGQPGTPPLPAPYPRTGQGGPPRMTIPDAITGNPSDHQCGVPGVALPGPGCYPYREPPPAPPPGGPPPGPPALPGPGQGQSLTPPAGVEQPAPGQLPHAQSPVLSGPGPIGPPPPTQGGGR